MLLSDGGSRLAASNPSGLSAGTRAVLAIKDQRLRLKRAEPHADSMQLEARVESVAYLGTAIQYVCRCGAERLIALVGNDRSHHALEPGTSIRIEWSAEDAVLLPEGSKP